MQSAVLSDAADTGVEIGEVGLDALLDDGILKEVPIIRTIVACRKTWESIRDRLFLQKVARFLFQCPQFSKKERQAFLDRYLAERATARELGDTLVLLLDRLDDLEKPEMLADVLPDSYAVTLTEPLFAGSQPR